MELKIDIIPSEEKKEDTRFLKLKNNDLLPKPPFYGCIIGATGTGKSSIIWTFVKKLYKNYFDHIIIYNGVKDANKAWSKLENDKVKVDVLNDFDRQEFSNFLDELEELQLKRQKKDKPLENVLVVFDDMITFGISKRNSIGILDRAVQNRRHFNLSILQNSQVYHQLNKSHRCLNTDFLIITSVNVKDAQSIAEEHSNGVNPDKVIDLINYVNKERFNFFMIDYRQDLENRFRKNLDVFLKIKS